MKGLDKEHKKMKGINTPYDDAFRTMLQECKTLIVPVVNEIFEKKLLFLIPFYIFTYESELKKINDSEERVSRLVEEYANIVEQLEELNN